LLASGEVERRKVARAGAPRRVGQGRMGWTRVSAAFGIAVAIASGSTGGVARAADGPSFDQVMAAPDDVKLNVGYAEAEAEAGHLLQAAAALERVLMVDPNQADARLLYAVVLYRLDDLQNASDQLRLLDSRALTPLQRAEAARYARLIAHRRKGGLGGVRFGGQFASGVSWDSDAAGALLTQLYLGYGPNPVLKQAGAGAVESGDVHIAVPFGRDDSFSVIGALSGYNRDTLSGGSNELQTFETRLGAAYNQPLHSFALMGVARTYRVLDHHYLDEYGGRGETVWRPTKRTTLTLSVEGVQQSYDIAYLNELVTQGVIPGNNNGPRYVSELDVAQRLGAHSILTGSLGYETKQSGFKPFGYQAPFLAGRWDLGLARGTYLNVMGNVRFVRYEEQDLVLFGTDHHDVDGYARIALGAPFSVFAKQGVTGDIREHLALEVAATWATRDIAQPGLGPPNYYSQVQPYHDYGGELRVVWRFGDKD
jgi:hypothetical protein